MSFRSDNKARYTAIAYWRGSQIVREAKALLPPAWNWAHDTGGRPQAAAARLAGVRRRDRRRQSQARLPGMARLT